MRNPNCDGCGSAMTRTHLRRSRELFRAVWTPLNTPEKMSYFCANPKSAFFISSTSPFFLYSFLYDLRDGEVGDPEPEPSRGDSQQEHAARQEAVSPSRDAPEKGRTGQEDRDHGKAGARHQQQHPQQTRAFQTQASNKKLERMQSESRLRFVVVDSFPSLPEGGVREAARHPDES